MQTDVIGRVPPHQIEAEMSVLGAMLLGNKEAVALALEMVNRADFYRDAHALIFDAMAMLHRRSMPVDIITLQNEMTQSGTLDGIGIEYLLTLSDVEFTTANVAYYASIVKDKSLKRQVIMAASEMAARAYRDDDTTATDLIQFAEKQIREIDTVTGSCSSIPLYDGMTQAMEAILKSRESGGVVGVTYGLSDVDDITGGLRKGELTVVAGRPSMGKTAFAIKAGHSAAQKGSVVAVFSLEMSTEQLCRRQYGALANVNGQKIQKAMLSNEEIDRMEYARVRCDRLPLEIVDIPKIKAMEMQSQARRIKVKHGAIDLIIVDYLLLMGRPDYLNRSSETRDVITANTREMKHLARQFDCPVMLLTQVGRSVERREDKRPILSDLAESGAIEAEADLVLFLYRPAYYSRHDDNGPESPVDECEVIVAKNRNGPTGTVPTAFYPAYVRFDNLERNRF